MRSDFFRDQRPVFRDQPRIYWPPPLAATVIGRDRDNGRNRDNGRHHDDHIPGDAVLQL